jgi:hypothetical protein
MRSTIFLSKRPMRDLVNEQAMRDVVERLKARGLIKDPVKNTHRAWRKLARAVREVGAPGGRGSTWGRRARRSLPYHEKYGTSRAGARRSGE